MIPELRTTRRVAIALAVSAVLAIAIALTFGHQIEDPLGDTAATAVLVAWCLIGSGVAIAAIVDAYLAPAGERLGLIVTIAATLFALLSSLVLAGIVAGATDVSASEPDAAERRAER